MPLEIRDPASCRWDLVSLGEVMLRLDPGEGRIATTRSFRCWEGGGEYNVARALRRCFRLRTAIVTALADNHVGRLIEDLMLQGGVDLAHLHWVPHDGVGRTVRNGLNFTERGFGIRGAIGVSDRGHTAVSQLKPGDIDWDRLFDQQGARWFHTGGIFAALSDSTPDVAREAMQAARRHGVIVSYDLNYRPSLWQSIGGTALAQAVNRALAPSIDVMLGGIEDFTTGLGVDVDDGSGTHDTRASAFERLAGQVIKAFPNVKAIATTLRTASSANRNDWGAVLHTAGQTYQAMQRADLEILDRVGGGDSFASGLIYGFLEQQGAQWAVDCGAAHGALAMTTPGDTSMATLDEVLKAMQSGTARVER